MNLLRKWGKKLLITGIVSVLIDMFLRMSSLSFLTDLGGTYLNFAMVALGAAGMYMDKNLNTTIETNDQELSLLINQAIAEEKKDKKIEQWDKDIIIDFLQHKLENNQSTFWIKNKKITVENDFNISLIIVFADKNSLISPTQEIILKDNKKYQQNKHELAIKKEYSEKIFFYTTNIIEEVFEKIIKLEKVVLQAFVPDIHNSILEVSINREMFNKLKLAKTKNNFEKLKFLEAKYNFDSKTFDFKT